MLDEIGQQQIEAGIPAVGEDERSTIKAIVDLNLKAQIIAWSRAVKSDIEDAVLCGIKAVTISIPVSDILLKHKLGRDRDWALRNLETTIRYARQRRIDCIYIGAEDSSRADMDFLIRLARLARDEGAQRLRFADTLGLLDPFRTRRLIRKLVNNVPDLDIEIHAHNDLGMATANSLAAIKAGAKSVNTTVCGLGERAGNTPLEEIVMALKYQEGMPLRLDTRRFKELAEEVSQAANRTIPPWKPIVGDNAFTHESGIHVDGLLKHPDTYQFINPVDVGQQCRLVIGKYSGSAGLVNLLRSRGIFISPQEARYYCFLYAGGSRLKRSLNDREVRTCTTNISNKL